MFDKNFSALTREASQALERAAELLRLWEKEASRRGGVIDENSTVLEWLSIREACDRQGSISHQSLRRAIEKAEDSLSPLRKGIHYTIAQGKKNQRIAVAYPLIFEALSALEG
jgi:hypothetical protein